MTGVLANRRHALDELGLVDMKYCHLVVQPRCRTTNEPTSQVKGV